MNKNKKDFILKCEQNPIIYWARNNKNKVKDKNIEEIIDLYVDELLNIFNRYEQ